MSVNQILRAPRSSGESRRATPQGIMLRNPRPATPARLPPPAFVASSVADVPATHPIETPLFEASARHGGLVDAQDIVGALRERHDQPLSMLARWIVRRDVVSFEWRGRCLLPRFQFSGTDLTPLPGVRRVADELASVFDDIELAAWFFRPCAWLDDCLPACAVVDRADAVHQAARADRWAARG